MVVKLPVQIHPETGIDKGQVKAVAVIGIDCIHATQGSQQVELGCIRPNELNQSVFSAIGQTDADNGYFVVEGAQTCGLDVKVSIKRQLQAIALLSDTLDLQYDSTYLGKWSTSALA